MKTLLLAFAIWMTCSGPASAEEIQALRFYRTPNNSLWFRNYAAGERALAKNDPTHAKAYFQEALNAIEKEPKPQELAPNKKDSFFLYRLSALEQRLVEGYPADWSKQDEDSKLQLQQEQVEVYDRLARLNTKFVEPTNLFVIRAKERSAAAHERLKKMVASTTQKDQEK